MPELPEVETVVRSIAPVITGQRIREAHFHSRLVTQGDFARISNLLRGARIRSVRRVGKHILIQLDRGMLHVHLGMTGKLLWNAVPTPYTRAVFELENGTLVYDDIRQLGRVNYYKDLPATVKNLGPDALAIGFDQFFERLRARHGGLKALLLNQRFISGIGNIYADEMLFAAGVHPKAASNRLSKARARKLFDEMSRILRSAIQHRGSSVSDYVDSDGAKGQFQMLHRVYGRAGSPCDRCARPIRRIVIAQRGTHYCPHCQRA
ncbi:MAG: bifunctional DNA-formamidopyrimidine glycosylase/DNA-(apurinic or apyrimidinic site) lyase [Bryobacteraceae bacterium]